jgi:hypothetical protein
VELGINSGEIDIEIGLEKKVNMYLKEEAEDSLPTSPCLLANNWQL